MTTINAILFDMDGLIFDTEALKYRAWDKAGLEMGYTDFGKNLYPNLGSNRDREYFAETYGKDFPYDEFVQRYETIIEEELRTKGMPQKPGLIPLLQYLKKNNYQLAIATSPDRALTKRHLTQAGIESYFSQIICGDMITHSKPDPEIYLKACEALDVSPEHALVLEDSRNGIRAALAAKIPVIMIPDLLKDFPEEEPFLAAKLDSLKDVIAWLEENNPR